MVNWYIFAIISAIFFGFQVVLSKLILTKGLNFALLTTYFFTITAIMLWIYTSVTEKLVLPSREIILLLVITSIIAVVSNLTLFKSYELVANPGYTRAIGSITIIVAFLLSIFIFNLRPDLIGVIGIILIVSGTILLARLI